MSNGDIDNLTFDDLVKPRHKDYWILDGTSRSYDLKEEVKAWGGYWVKDHRAWRIDCLDKNSNAYNTLKSCGLVLQPT